MPPCMTAMTRTLFVVPPVTPNPSLKLTRYGWLCEPGLWHMVHHHRPGSHSRLRRQLSAHVRPRTPRKAPLQGLRDLQHLEVTRSGCVFRGTRAGLSDCSRLPSPIRTSRRFRPATSRAVRSVRCHAFRSRAAGYYDRERPVTPIAVSRLFRRRSDVANRSEHFGRAIRSIRPTETTPPGWRRRPGRAAALS